jgi:single-stranded DNA-specific DHH superfamily exonuclease
MLTEKQLKEIREYLEGAQNPIFYYDNDADGLAAFLIMWKFIGRGKGVAVRGAPDLNRQYAKRAEQLNADVVFVLDVPLIGEDFLDEFKKKNMSVIWIDHHDIPNKDYHNIPNLINYNPNNNYGKEKSSEPTSYLCYKVTERKEDEWIALCGCIADHYMPDFASEFAKENPEMWGKGIKKPFDAYYKTEIGKVAQLFNLGLKDSTSNIVDMQKYLVKCKTPLAVFEDEKMSFVEKYEEIRKKLDDLIKEVKSNKEDKAIFYLYAGEMSISSELANEISYNFPGKYVIVGYKKGAIVNLSLRGKGIRKIMEKAIKDLEGASGGGHEDAVGARIQAKDFEKFKETIENQLK